MVDLRDCDVSLSFEVLVLTRWLSTELRITGRTIVKVGVIFEYNILIDTSFGFKII